MPTIQYPTFPVPSIQNLTYAELGRFVNFKEYKQKNIDHTIKCIELAYMLDITLIRRNTGTFVTSKSFDDLMKNHGIEQPMPDYTEDDGFKWVIGSIEKCLPKAKRSGVILGLENHWGLARTPQALLRIVKAVDSP